MGCGSSGIPMGQPEPAGGRMVMCVKFQREMPGLAEPPFDGHPLGQRIYENVSKEAWKMWLEQ
jgi:Fe-S cluster protector protein